MEEGEPKSGGGWVAMWETPLQMLGLIVLLAIVLSLLLPTIPKAIFDAVVDSVADLAADLAYMALMKFIQELFVRIKTWVVVFAVVSSYYSGFAFFFVYDLCVIIYEFFFSDFGLINTLQLLYSMYDLISDNAHPRRLK
ncbi:unnamed protein product [Spirodela intermedia]|uniref:Uncharacterized protein n=1 Tax=Spirodela intermedia TaxID=51605 RepID=A0A7I8I9D1_SPIIN|nr:unnamed protein product [Spirodela intermedia]CAA6654297.1 unnamed protein product [Spirodela intermedia]